MFELTPNYLGLIFLGMVGITALVCWLALRDHNKWIEQQNKKTEEFSKKIHELGNCLSKIKDRRTD